MAWISILDRFRPVGTPGPAGPSGVPAVDGQGAGTELAPVFAALAADIQACEDLVATARRQSDHALAVAGTQAAAIVSQARLDAGVARAAAAVRVEQEAGDRDTWLLDQARRDAAAVKESGTASIPAVVDRVVDTLLAPENAGAQ